VGSLLGDGDAGELAGEAGDGPAGPHAETSRARMVASARADRLGVERRRIEGWIPGRAVLTPRD
jgi:hypothetical protein